MIGGRYTHVGAKNLLDILQGTDERTLSDLYDAMGYDEANDRVNVRVEAHDDNPPNLDVALSTRATENTLTSLLTELQAKADTAEAQAIQDPPGLSDLATQATLASVLTELEGKADTGEAQAIQNPSNLDVGLSTRAADATVAGATDYEVYNLDLGTTRTDTALEGTSMTIRWVKLQVYTGADTDLSSPDQYIRIGTDTDPKIPLSTMARPDSDVLFEGRITGDVYVTNTSQTGDRLVLLVGVE